MNSQSEFLSAAARKLIDQHLDAVERHLAAAGTDRATRRSVCDELETQIAEMLRSRNAEQPTDGEVAAVLQELDAPESYGKSDDKSSIEAVLSAVSLPTGVPKVALTPFMKLVSFIVLLPLMALLAYILCIILLWYWTSR